MALYEEGLLDTAVVDGSAIPNGGTQLDSATDAAVAADSWVVTRVRTIAAVAAVSNSVSLDGYSKIAVAGSAASTFVSGLIRHYNAVEVVTAQGVLASTSYAVLETTAVVTDSPAPKVTQDVLTTAVAATTTDSSWITSIARGVGAVARGVAQAAFYGSLVVTGVAVGDTGGVDAGHLYSQATATTPTTYSTERHLAYKQKGLVVGAPQGSLQQMGAVVGTATAAGSPADTVSIRVTDTAVATTTTARSRTSSARVVSPAKVAGNPVLTQSITTNVAAVVYGKTATGFHDGLAVTANATGVSSYASVQTGGLSSAGIGGDAQTMAQVLNYVVATKAGVTGSLILPPTGHFLVMNTESGAISRYDALPANAIVGTPMGLAVAMADGVYLLDRRDDSVNAQVVYAYHDFMVKGSKRLENVWLDVRGGDDMQMSAQVLSESPAAYTYPIENRTSTAPRSTRFVPGRGLHGVYWKLVFSGTHDFEVFKLAADVAEAKRRV